MRKLFYIFLIAFLFNTPKANANCNFKEANYIKELSTPNKIKGINILGFSSYVLIKIVF